MHTIPKTLSEELLWADASKDYMKDHVEKLPLSKQFSSGSKGLLMNYRIIFLTI